MKKGFTLIELLAVIAIIGILGLLVVSNLTGVINNSKQDAYDLQVDEMISAARIYATENYKALPNLKTVGGRQYLTISDLVTLGYMDEVPTDPLTGNVFSNTKYIKIEREINDSLSYEFVDSIDSVGFSKIYGGEETEENGIGLENPDGTFVFASWTYSETGIPAGGDASDGWADIYVYKIDANGNKVWEKTYGGSEQEELHAITRTKDGGYLLGGSTTVADLDLSDSDPVDGGNDLLVIKIDANGNKVWSNTYGGTGWEDVHAMASVPSGGYVLYGWTYSDDGDFDSNNGEEDVFVIKIAEDGTVEWANTYGGSSFEDIEYFGEIVVLPNEEFFLYGWTKSSANGDITDTNNGLYDSFIMKLDASGKRIFSKNFGGNDSDYLRDVLFLADGGYMLVGNTNSSASGDIIDTNNGLYDGFIMRLDNNFDVVWEKTYGGSGNDGFAFVSKLLNGNYLIVGWTFSTDGDIATGVEGNASDYWLLEVDGTGGIITNKTFGGDSYEELHSIFETRDGGFVISGSTCSTIGQDIYGPMFGGDDIFVLKLKSDLTY